MRKRRRGVKNMSDRPKNTATGYKKEKAVVSWLERHGFEISYEGGRGPADIIATDGSRRWYIQVKYTRKTKMDSSRFSKERESLIKMADQKHGTAVLCYVVQSTIWFVSAKTNETLQRGFL